MIVEVTWPDEIDSDVDLWVQAPGDIPVGYSNKGGVIFNLLRDDLGKRVDATGLNYEVSYARGILAGEYTVNVHLYRNPASILPIPVTVVTSVKSGARRARQLLASQIELAREGEELTVYRFKLGADGGLVRAACTVCSAICAAKLEVVMTELTYLFAAVAVARRRDHLRQRVVAAAARAQARGARRRALFLAAYAGFRPSATGPSRSASNGGTRGRRGDRAGSSIREDEGIYLWLQLTARRAARLHPALEPRPRRGAPERSARPSSGQRRAHAPAVRALARRPRAQVLRHAAAGAAAQGPRRPARSSTNARPTTP